MEAKDPRPTTATCHAYGCGRPYNPRRPQDHWTSNGHTPEPIRNPYRAT